MAHEGGWGLEMGTRLPLAEKEVCSSFSPLPFAVCACLRGRRFYL